jgi:uncharacterized membrane protein
MMKTRMIPAAIMALVLVAASAAVVHAGGGGQGVPLDVFVVDCYLISGSNPPHVLTLDDQFFPGPDSLRTGVKLGKAKLLCTLANVTVTSGNDVRAGLQADHLKCYEAPPAGAVPNVQVQVVDPFLAETVKVGVPRFVCVGAVKCPVGVDCPGE